MWAISNETTFAAERSFVRDRDGSEIWIVAVSATFGVSDDGTVFPADEQRPVILAPSFFGEPAHSSLRYESDLVRTKAGTDVILHGSAYAPGRSAVGSVETELSVGSIRKRLRVFGSRSWELTPLGLAPSAAQNFLKQEIRYELALGGLLNEESVERDPWNPAGIGRIAKQGALAPSLEMPDAPVTDPGSKERPAGYGPIPGHWKQRVELAGTYDDSWQQSRQPLVPEDFDDTFFRSAPPDQQMDRFLQGGEEVVLRNLTPAGVLRFSLPRVSIGFRTRINSETVHHRGELHTLILEPDEQRFVMVWQTALPCHHTLYTLKETVVFEKKRQNPANPDDSRLAATAP